MPSIGPGGIAYQQGGRVHLLELPNERLHDVPVAIPDDTHAGRQILGAEPFIRHEDIISAPDYALGIDGTAYFVARGQLFAVRTNGSYTNLFPTRRTAVDHPAVSRDGRQLAFIAYADGEQQLAIMPAEHAGPVRILSHFRSGVLYTPLWSPDGHHLTVADANKRLWLVGTSGHECRRIAFDKFAEIHDAAFSPDSRRLAYSTTRDNQTRAIHLRDLTTDKDVIVSAALESDRSPLFSMDGEQLFFISARKEHPFVSDRDREGTIATLGSEALYQATAPADLEGDLTLFATSAREVPLNLAGGIAVQVYGETLFYHAAALRGIDDALPGQANGLHAVDLPTCRDRVVGDSPNSYVLSPDGKAALVSYGSRFGIIGVSGTAGPERPLRLDAMHVSIDPAKERSEMFEQAWRLDRDLFWDATLDGVDWQSVHDKYARLVARASSHEDMLYLIGELQGELSTSHMFISGGDSGDSRPVTPQAQIGADFELDGATRRYRLAHIYRGDESRSRFHAPLGDPKLGVADGDYLLAVNGVQLVASDDPYRLLTDDTKPILLTVSSTAEGAVRNITVVPVSSEREIRKLDWIQSRRAFVDKVSDGRIGYVYLSDFYELGSEDFVRQYYPQSDRAGLVIDARDNRGFTSQWVLDLLRRPQAGIFRNREDGVTMLPGAIAPAHIATVINLFSGSDGDQFPYFFRLWGMGPVIGQRTWGGVRGIKGPWTLVDGTTITVPKDSLLSSSGAKIIEGRGAEPDI